MIFTSPLLHSFSGKVVKKIWSTSCLLPLDHMAAVHIFLRLSLINVHTYIGQFIKVPTWPELVAKKCNVLNSCSGKIFCTEHKYFFFCAR